MNFERPKLDWHHPNELKKAFHTALKKAASKSPILVLCQSNGVACGYVFPAWYTRESGEIISWTGNPLCDPVLAWSFWPDAPESLPALVVRMDIDDVVHFGRTCNASGKTEKESQDLTP